MSKGKVFTAPEVQAIIAGNKTMFKEICKRQPYEQTKPYLIEKMVGGFSGRTAIAYPFGEPAYQKGQKIFVKESFSTDWVNYDDTFGESCVGDISYEATWEKDNAKGFFDEPKWKPAQHMKQEHSRLTLQIKEIRVERLQSISAEDCFKEGVSYSPECCQNYIAVADCNGNPTPSCCNNPNLADPRIDFRDNWNATHKKPEEKFEANPFVWSIQFEVVK